MMACESFPCVERSHEVSPPLAQLHQLPQIGPPAGGQIQQEYGVFERIQSPGAKAELAKIQCIQESECSLGVCRKLGLLEAQDFRGDRFPETEASEGLAERF
jgi:hypothetical protein